LTNEEHVYSAHVIVLYTYVIVPLFTFKIFSVLESSGLLGLLWLLGL
jgi:hypothetical protein